MSKDMAKITIALDAMGGDHAPLAILEGADKALKKKGHIEFLIFGDQAQLLPIVERMPRLQGASTLFHTDQHISNEEKPSAALRKGRHSSMGMAIRAVRDQQAQALVSGGNTGALMALSKILLGTLPGIDRPAIGTAIPTEKGASVVLDLGANVSCDANNLFEFAVMGDAFARILLGKKDPSIGLLNIGSEDMKGNEAVRAAATLLRESELPLHFYGNIEGDDIGKGTVDVVVTDGFTGNVALKTAEGTAHMLNNFVRRTFARSPLAWLGVVFMCPTLLALKKKFDPRQYNGAMLLGLNGIVVKSHGGTDVLGVMRAIEVAENLASHQINTQILKEMVESGHIPSEEEGFESDVPIQE